jgi:hypothetical protein
MGVAVLELLKAVEKEFGEEGQKVCREVMVGTGKKVALKAFENVEIHEEMSPVELASLLSTWVNTRFYASLEEPRIKNEDECDFDILWCPHQDVYKPFDCRVQRYFVQGILEAATEKGIYRGFNSEFTCIMPAGADVCHFRVRRAAPGEPMDLWNKVTKELEERAFK